MQDTQTRTNEPERAVEALERAAIRAEKGPEAASARPASPGDYRAAIDLYLPTVRGLLDPIVMSDDAAR